MINLVYIAVGGAIGALLRYGTAHGVHALLGRGFPYGTLTVNVIGSVLVGLCYVLFVERLPLEPHWRAALFIGLLGSFTTFSAFSMETVNLIEAGQQARAVLNILFNVVLCVGGCWLGLAVGRQF